MGVWCTNAGVVLVVSSNFENSLHHNTETNKMTKTGFAGVEFFHKAADEGLTYLRHRLPDE